MRIFLFIFAGLVLSGCASTPKAAAPVCEDCPRDGHFNTVVSNGMSALFYVRGTLNGQPRKFLLDTGAYRSSLGSDELTKKLPVISQGGVMGVAEQPQACDWVSAETFVLNGWMYPKAPFLRCQNIPQYGFILGIDYLDHQLVSLNFDKGTFKFLRQAPKDLKTLPMKRISNRFITLPITLAGGPQDAVLDTGCGITTVDQAYVDAHPDDFAPATMEVNGKDVQVQLDFHDSTWVHLMGKIYVTQSLKIGDLQIPGVLINAISFGPELRKNLSGASVVIGANAMSWANWFLNLKDDVWSVTPIKPVDLKLNAQVTAETVTREGKNVTLQGHVSLAQGKHTLTAEKIVISETGAIECSGNCQWSDGEKTETRPMMKFTVTNGEWSNPQ